MSARQNPSAGNKKAGKDEARGSWLICLLAVLTIGVLGLQGYDQPGIYMDGVNPDYLAARMWTGSRYTAAWTLPGNDLLHARLPVLTALYHGSLTAYLTVPFFAALGGTVLSLRLAHLALAAIVAASLCLFVRATTRSRVAVAAALGLLATDPAFLLTFRSQAYIATFPVCFVLAALTLLRSPTTVRWRTVAAGALLGLSVWGYFVYAFMLPGILVYFSVERAIHRRPVIRGVLLLALGLAIGVFPYAVGYLLMFIRKGGIDGGLLWLRDSFGSLAIDCGQTYADRVAFVVEQIGLVVTASWHQATFFGNVQPIPGAVARAAGLAAIIVAAVPLALRPGVSPPAAGRRGDGWLIASPILSFIVVATLFGGRLGGHHFCLLIPMLYGLVAISGKELVAAAGQTRSAAVVATVIVLSLGAANVATWLALHRRLAEEGGQHLYSRIISDYPRSVRASGDATPHLFAEWGGLMPFIYLTEGRVPAYQETPGPLYFCRFPHSRVVFLGDEGVDRGRRVLAIPNLQIEGEGRVRDPKSGFTYTIFSVRYSDAGCAGRHPP
jgi:4-amino-4-deoxy-L-arabinose transferase and related glycosyltransferases of PMT family